LATTRHASRGGFGAASGSSARWNDSHARRLNWGLGLGSDPPRDDRSGIPSGARSSFLICNE